ncbi:hypothetical protein LTR02_012248 [Friedmanniomyces endolithicus]|nr:hypothetical protein LTR02_012248 [Friedmanniomyces endolithicus]
MVRECEVSSSQAKAIRKCDFSYFAAIMVPDADAATFRVICDWGNWIFPFDDLFDDGELRQDEPRARKVLTWLSSSFKQPLVALLSYDEDVNQFGDIVAFHDHISTFIRSSELGGQKPAILAGHCNAHRHYRINGPRPSVEEVFKNRRQSVCVAPLFVLMQLGQRIALPSDIFEDPVLQREQELAIDLILLHNDLLSYPKEEAEGVPHNMVAACRANGMTAQEAVDYIAREIDTLHDKLEHAAKELFSHYRFHELSGQLHRCACGIRSVIKANLYWSFWSGRFFTKDVKSQLLKGEAIDVLLEPSYLTSQYDRQEPLS